MSGNICPICQLFHQTWVNLSWHSFLLWQIKEEKKNIFIIHFIFLQGSALARNIDGKNLLEEDHTTFLIYGYRNGLNQLEFDGHCWTLNTEIKHQSQVKKNANGLLLSSKYCCFYNILDNGFVANVRKSKVKVTFGLENIFFSVA